MSKGRLEAFSDGVLAIIITIMVKQLIARHGKDSTLAKAIGRDLKGKISMLLYVIGIVSVWISPWIGIAMYVIVALIWLIPDRRIANRLVDDHSSGL
jgi:uncharacterized membrane protein